jgi:MFS family permease
LTIWTEHPTTRYASLSIRNYRLFFLGQLGSVSGTWMQTVAQSFLVLQLGGSGTTLGLATAARFAPVLLFGQWGGLAADRLDRRRLLLVTQLLAGLVAAVFGVLVLTGVVTLWMVFVLAAVLGCVNAFDTPTRQTLISDLVPPSHLSNAVALNSIMQNAARFIGGGVAGIVVSLTGLGACFELNAASYAFVLVMLARMSPAEMVPVHLVPRARGQIREGLRHAARTPELGLPLLMVMVIGALAWEFQISLPLLAAQTFHGSASTYGVMAAVMGAGAVVGGVIAAGRRSIGLRSLAVAAVGWGIAILATGLAPRLWLAYALLALVGYGSVIFNSLAKTTLQLRARPEMRGRVMALWVLAWQGSTPIGGPIIGKIGEVFGARWSLLTGACAAIGMGLALLPVLTRLDARSVAVLERAGSRGPGPVPAGSIPPRPRPPVGCPECQALGRAGVRNAPFAAPEFESLP